MSIDESSYIQIIQKNLKEYLDIKFPYDKFERLIIDISWESMADWINFWENQKNILSINQFWNDKVNDD